MRRRNKRVYASTSAEVRSHEIKNALLTTIAKRYTSCQYPDEVFKHAKSLLPWRHQTHRGNHSRCWTAEASPASATPAGWFPKSLDLLAHVLISNVAITPNFFMCHNSILSADDTISSAPSKHAGGGRGDLGEQGELGGARRR